MYTAMREWHDFFLGQESGRVIVSHPKKEKIPLYRNKK